MTTHRSLFAAALCLVALACGGADSTADTPPAESATTTRTGGPALARWTGGGTAYGMFVPSERDPAERDSAGNRLPPLYTEAGARALASDSLLDYLFLNLEGAYDEVAVRTLVAGRDAGTHGPTLLVRLPTIEAAGADSTRARVAQVLALGADGVVIPHVRSAEEAALAVSFFADANVWSPANPAGTVIAMLMVEDRGAIAALDAIANVPGYSLLSCGIGSLTRAMDGDREGAEAACLRVREAASARGLPSMMTATDASLADRLVKGYRGILLSGTLAQVRDVIVAGRAMDGGSSAQALYDTLLRALQDTVAPGGRRVVRPGVSLSIDFAGLDTALGTLGLVSDHDAAALQRRHPRVRLEPHAKVTACGRAAGGVERCVITPGVLSLRFLAPRRIGADELVMELGQYETVQGRAVTGGVQRVWLRRAANGWEVARVEGLARA